MAAVNGVKNVSVNLLKNTMSVSYDESAADRADIEKAVMKAVESAGYGVTRVTAPNRPTRLVTTVPMLLLLS